MERGGVSSQTGPAIAPIEIRRVCDDSGRGVSLAIQWSDGVAISLPNAQLRKACPCATCRESAGTLDHARPLAPREVPGEPLPPSAKRRSMLAVVSATIDESIDLQSVWPVGRYAVGLRWGDGHDTGIYSFDFLRALGTPPTNN